MKKYAAYNQHQTAAFATGSFSCCESANLTHLDATLVASVFVLIRIILVWVLRLGNDGSCKRMRACCY